MDESTYSASSEEIVHLLVDIDSSCEILLTTRLCLDEMIAVNLHNRIKYIRHSVLHQVRGRRDAQSLAQQR